MDAHYHHLEDEAVVAMAQGGSRAAEEHLLRKYRRFVESRTRSFFLPGAEREDMLQEGMIGLFKAIRDYHYHPGSSFLNFADLCIGRQIISAVKTATRQKQRLMNGSVSLEDEDEDGVMLYQRGIDLRTPELIVIEAQMLALIIEKMLQELSPLEAAAAACFLDDCTYGEAADKLGRGTKCVDNARQRVKTKLGQFVTQIAGG